MAYIQTALDKHPRQILGHFPTPIELMKNLSSDIAPHQMYVKRDDCTGLAFGGNKVRQLEYYFGRAVAERADTVLITGAVQSNFVRTTAAAAAKLGMDCHIQLEHRVDRHDDGYRLSGNVLLDKMLGATLYEYPDGEDEAGADARLHAIADGLRNDGRNPYIIPLAPGHAPTGALGYVAAAGEILEQLSEQGIEIDEILVGSGSGHTHAGLLFGLRANGSSLPVRGICVRRDAEAQRPRILSRCQEIAELLGVVNGVADDDVHVCDDVLSPGYGHLNPATHEAISKAARWEGLILDPVYTGKALAGGLLLAEAQAKPTTYLFVHTGGTPSVFAYAKELSEAWG